MGFFSFFSQEKHEQISQLHKKLQMKFPQLDDNELELYASYAGVLARVAYADLKITDDEKVKIHQSIKDLTDFNENEALIITQLCIDDMNELSGLEDHYYTRFLSQNLDEPSRSKLLCTLFSIAAADENVDAKELEAIRSITTGLNLSHQHFIAAKAQVKDYLVSLRRGSK